MLVNDGAGYAEEPIKRCFADEGFQPIQVSIGESIAASEKLVDDIG